MCSSPSPHPLPPSPVHFPWRPTSLFFPDYSRNHQHRLQEAQKKHEQRRKELGMVALPACSLTAVDCLPQVPGDHRPKPPSKSRLEEVRASQRCDHLTCHAAAQAERPRAAEHEREGTRRSTGRLRLLEKLSVTKVADSPGGRQESGLRRQGGSKSLACVAKADQSFQNFKNVVEKPSSQHSVRDSSSLGVFHADESDGVVQEQVVNSNQQRMKEQVADATLVFSCLDAPAG
eukprot:766383-Hanusia_phi.AAC.4